MNHKRSSYPLRAGAGLLLALVCVLAPVCAAESSGHSAAVVPGSGELLRLHIVAHSDAPADQAAKLAVRDVLMARMKGAPLPSDRAQMEHWVRERAGEWAAAAEQALAQRGAAGPVRIEIGSFAFPEKRWGDVVLPPGEYRAVRVVIGDGKGENWWCVLFPPLCFAEDDEGEDTGAAPRELIARAEGASPVEDLVHAAADEASEAARWAEWNDGGGKPGGVIWRLRLWEYLSSSTAIERVKELVDASLAVVRKRGL